MKRREPVAVKGHVRLVPLLHVYVSFTVSMGKKRTQFPVTTSWYVLAAEALESINERNDPLLDRLQSVFVKSTDTVTATEVSMSVLSHWEGV